MPVAVGPNHSQDLVRTPFNTELSKDQLVVSFHPNTDLEKQFPAPLSPVGRRTSSACMTLGTEATEDNSECSDTVTEVKEVKISIEEPEQMGIPMLKESLSNLAEDTQSSDEADTAAEKPKLPEKESRVKSRGVSKSVARGSIIKISPLEEIPVKEGRFAWMQLPKPDMTKIRAASAPCTGTQSATEAQVRRRASGVVFHEVLIRNYEQTIGDNPSVSYGPPISLDWEYEEAVPITLDEYERNRGPRRNTRQMMLNYYNRKNLLTWRCGATEEQMKAAEKEGNKIKGQRSLTKAFLPAQKFEEVFQSARRKTRRMAGGSKS
jgi:hypothetical protein